MTSDLNERARSELRRVLGEMESLAPPAPSLEPRAVELEAPAHRRTSRPLLVAVGAAVAVLVLALPIVLLSRGSGIDQPEAATSPAPVDEPTVSSLPTDIPNSTIPTDQTATSVIPNVAVPQVTVREIEDPALPADGPPSERIQEAYSATGRIYDPLPDLIQDVAVKDGRIVIVGGEWKAEGGFGEGEIALMPGDFEQTAGIWYSDGGAWIEAPIDYGPNIQLGAEIGEHLPPDGIRDIAATDSGFVAWTPINTVASHPIGPAASTEQAGTLVLTSPDGTAWETHLIPEQITRMIGFEDGYLALFEVVEPATPASRAMWTSDLDTWTEIHDFGNGLAFEMAALGRSVIVGIHYWDAVPIAEPDGDTSAHVVEGSEEDRWFELTPNPTE